MSGATGLDYAGVRAYLQMVCPRKEMAETFRCIQAIELEMLEFWGEKRAQQAAEGG